MENIEKKKLETHNWHCLETKEDLSGSRLLHTIAVTCILLHSIAVTGILLHTIAVTYRPTQQRLVDFCTFEYLSFLDHFSDNLQTFAKLLRCNLETISKETNACAIS